MNTTQDRQSHYECVHSCALPLSLPEALKVLIKYLKYQFGI